MNAIYELLVRIGRLNDEENVTAYEAQIPDETLRLLILQSRGLVRLYKSKEAMGLPYALSAELTDAGLQLARELRQIASAAQERNVLRYALNQIMNYTRSRYVDDAEVMKEIAEAALDGETITPRR